MCPGNSDLKRGQISLFALMLITIFLQLGLAHQKLILLYVKGNQAGWSARTKDELMMNALHLIRQDRNPGPGLLDLGDERLDYAYRRQQTDDMIFEMAVARFEERDYWPVMSRQWITIGTRQFSVVDYWRES